MSDYVLYSYFRSSASYRVRIALNLKKISYEYRAVHLVNNGGEQKTPEYLKLNPSSEVPTLVYKGQALAQSVAICYFLEAQKPEPTLFSKDPFESAQILQFCEVINSGIQPFGNLKVLGVLESKHQYSADEKANWMRFWMGQGFAILEKLLVGQAGPFCFGMNPTAADVFLVPQVYNAHRYNVDMEKFPRLNQIYKNCLKLKPFHDAAPERQPDTPADLKA